MYLHIARRTVNSDDVFILPLELGQCQHSGRNFFQMLVFFMYKSA